MDNISHTTMHSVARMSSSKQFISWYLLSNSPSLTLCHYSSISRTYPIDSAFIDLRPCSCMSAEKLICPIPVSYISIRRSFTRYLMFGKAGTILSLGSLSVKLIGGRPMMP